MEGEGRVIARSQAFNPGLDFKMSQETLTDLNNNVLIGYTDKRGKAWHYRENEQGVEPNHYAGPIPLEDVERRLFHWTALEGEITATVLTEDGVIVTHDTERKAIMRSDTGAVLGIFKQGYKPHQYQEWLATNVASILDADLKIGSAGTLAGGARGWVQIEMADTLSVEGVDYRPFLTAATSFDGSLATTYLTGSQMVVCDNTLSAALSSKEHQYKLRHSTNSLGKLADARAALQIVHSVADTFAEQVRSLMQIKVSNDEFQMFLSEYLELTDDKREKGGRAWTVGTNKRDRLTAMWYNDARVAPFAGTAFGVVQAVNTFDHHEGSVRGGNRVERNMDKAITGGFDKLDADTFGTLSKVLQLA